MDSYHQNRDTADVDLDMFFNWTKGFGNEAKSRRRAGGKTIIIFDGYVCFIQ